MSTEFLDTYSICCVHTNKHVASDYNSKDAEIIYSTCVFLGCILQTIMEVRPNFVVFISLLTMPGCARYTTPQ